MLTCAAQDEVLAQALAAHMGSVDGRAGGGGGAGRGGVDYDEIRKIIREEMSALQVIACMTGDQWPVTKHDYAGGGASAGSGGRGDGGETPQFLSL